MIKISSISRPTSKGRLGSVLSKLYTDEQEVFGKKYLTCGTTVGLVLNNINISVCPAKDKKCGVFESGWANTNLITGMQYTNATISQAQKHQIADNKKISKKDFTSLYKPKDAHWMEFFMSLIFLYDREYIENLVKIGLARYFEKAKDSISYADVYENPEEFLGEYQIVDSRDMPNPSIILVGTPVIKFNKNYINERYPLLLQQIQNKFTSADVVYYENLTLRYTNKRNEETGVFAQSFQGLKVLQDVNCS